MSREIDTFAINFSSTQPNFKVFSSVSTNQFLKMNITPCSFIFILIVGQCWVNFVYASSQTPNYIRPRRDAISLTKSSSKPMQSSSDQANECPKQKLGETTSESNNGPSLADLLPVIPILGEKKPSWNANVLSLHLSSFCIQFFLKKDYFKPYRIYTFILLYLYTFIPFCKIIQPWSCQ